MTKDIKKYSITHVVKIDNSFNKTHSFDRLNAELQNIAWAIISSFSTGDAEQKPIKSSLHLNGAEIRKLAGITNRHSMTRVTYESLLIKLRDFFLTQYFVVHLEKVLDDGKTHYVEHGQRIFDSFDIIDSGETIDIKLADGATRFFSHIFPGIGFSVFALKNMIAIKKPTAKTLYRLFLDGSHIHGWVAYREEIESIFGYQKSTAWGSFLRRLDDYISEIKQTGDFEVLGYTRIVDETKRGHPVIAVQFNIKLKSGRLENLIADYNNSKTRKKTSFYPISISQEICTEPELQSVDGIVRAVNVGKTTKIVNVKCPSCGGIILAFKQAKDGKVAFCCDNSAFWRLGSHACRYYCREDETERQAPGIRKWLNDVRKNANGKSIAEFIDVAIQAENESVKSTRNSSDLVYDSNDPFGFNSSNKD